MRNLKILHTSLAELEGYKNLAEKEIKEWEKFLKAVNKRIKNHAMTKANVADANLIRRTVKHEIKKATK